jgi:4-hydroxy-3-methylbut-2-enyl diphosphate reductase
VPSHLIDGPRDLEISWFEKVKRVGISSGASAPEHLVQEVVAWIEKEFPGSTHRDAVLLEENVHFPLPQELL